MSLKFRKTTSLTLALVLAGLAAALFFTSAVFASDEDLPAVSEEQAEESSGKNITELPYAGITLNTPQEFIDAKGCITVGSSGETSEDSGVYLTTFLYIAMPGSEAQAILSNDSPTIDDLTAFFSACYPLAYIFSINGERSKEDLAIFFEGLEENLDDIYEIGEAQDNTFYFMPVSAEDFDIPEEYAEEYEDLCSHPELFTDNLEFSVPEEPSEFSAQDTISFETTDVYGNPVSSSELFGQNKITMINIWTSWCIYCIREMPELENLNREFQELGCGITGFLYDGNEDGALEEAKEILESAGVTYPNFLPWEGYEQTFSVQAFPTTVFVDSQGNLVGDSVLGADIEAYKEGLAKALELIGE